MTAEEPAERLRMANLLIASYLGARRRMTPQQAWIAALGWVAAYADYVAGCAAKE